MAHGRVREAFKITLTFKEVFISLLILQMHAQMSDMHLYIGNEMCSQRRTQALFEVALCVV